MSTANIFRNYTQEENRFTNGLLALLRLSTYDGPQFVTAFLRDLLSVEPKEGIDSFRVLRETTGTVDAELCGKDCCVCFETKIVSATLRDIQVRAHLDNLRCRSESIKKLVLLTPDDGTSQYVDQFLSIDRAVVQHLAWNRVYLYLKESIGNRSVPLFSELVRQFLDIIRDDVFEQDIAGIIPKIHFGNKSDVYQ